MTSPLQVGTTPPVLPGPFFTQLNTALAGLSGSPQAAINSAATVDLGSVASLNILIANSVTITSFGSNANLLQEQFKWLRFSGSPLITANATTLITPTGGNIQANPGDVILAMYLGSGNWRVLLYIPVVSGVREKLNTARTYFIRTDGSDSNTGLVNNAGGAFLTIQKAVDVVTQNIDTAGFAVTISVQAGTYLAGVSLSKSIFGGGTLVISGNTGAPSTVFINTAGPCISVSGTGNLLSVQGLKLASSVSDCINVQFGGRIIVSGNMEFGVAASAHCHSVYGGIIDLSSISYSITGNAVYHYWGEVAGSLVRAIGAATVTVAGGLTFTAFVNADNLSGIDCLLQTFSANPTAKRYSATNNSVIGTFGSGVNYFPGTVAGTTATGGIYF